MRKLVTNMGWSSFKPGDVFNRWTVVEGPISKKNGRGAHKYYKCVCICGIIRTVQGSYLKTGRSKSCGCLVPALAFERSKKQNKENYARTWGTIEYFKCNTWGHMKNRCINTGKYDKRNKSYFDKKIKLLISKEEFYSWCEVNKDLILSIYARGESPSVDRIDNLGHYTLNNMQILSFSDNLRKRRMDAEALKED